jgi:RNA-dependent RNA polymerase
LLILHPGPQAYEYDRPQAWLRPSQVKIAYSDADLDDASKRSLDIVRTDHMRSPARASTEMLINWAENGVPADALAACLRATLQGVVDLLTDFEQSDAMQRLWYTIAASRGVLGQRRARQASGEARARGLAAYDYGDEEDGEEDEEGFDPAATARERSTAWWPDEVSGCPSTLEETVLALLDSGFMPTCGVLADKLEKIITAVLNSYVKPPRFKVEIAKSCIAFITPGLSSAAAVGLSIQLTQLQTLLVRLKRVKYLCRAPGTT